MPSLIRCCEYRCTGCPDIASISYGPSTPPLPVPDRLRRPYSLSIAAAPVGCVCVPVCNGHRGNPPFLKSHLRMNVCACRPGAPASSSRVDVHPPRHRPSSVHVLVVVVVVVAVVVPVLVLVLLHLLLFLLFPLLLSQRSIDRLSRSAAPFDFVRRSSSNVSSSLDARRRLKACASRIRGEKVVHTAALTCTLDTTSRVA